MDGDNANLDEFANYCGVTAVCAVNEHDTRSSYSEMGANLWVCAPSGDRAQDYRGIVTTENSDRHVADFSGTSGSTPALSHKRITFQHTFQLPIRGVKEPKAASSAPYSTR